MVEQNTRNFAKLKYNLQAKVGFDLTQQDSRKKRTTKRLSVTNVTGLLLAVLSWSSIKLTFSGQCFTKRSI